jgi:hypothetical protein
MKSEPDANSAVSAMLMLLVIAVLPGYFFGNQTLLNSPWKKIWNFANVTIEVGTK